MLIVFGAQTVGSRGWGLLITQVALSFTCLLVSLVSLRHIGWVSNSCILLMSFSQFNVVFVKEITIRNEAKLTKILKKIKAIQHEQFNQPGAEGI